MITLKKKSFYILSILSIYFLASFSSCASRKYQTDWMDLPHARKLDKKKGKQSKKLQKHAGPAKQY
ncbi:hypothetical protein BFP72_04405 [Reichenbachiella sp. 5M10]|uniref:hypothetical protein n=1 Tax=Reichenbachiella sp. 5M10 TaxID=1889772 RepID=UPI000C15420A|nr:hypothetical protein [Reichenbachiella sp. 5M10]PIB34702.1 hypothetical protein BFP72_04405 [Reichenbachiella sp. 5M10]